MLYNDHTNIQQHKNNGNYAEHLLKYSNIKITVSMQNTYSNRVPSMLITSSKISSQEASTTPTAFIALPQLLGYIKNQREDNCISKIFYEMWHSTKTRIGNNAQGNQLPEVLQKYEVLSMSDGKSFQFIQLQHIQTYTTIS